MATMAEQLSGMLEHFGDIEKLRAATAAEISDVAGFGGKMAAELHTFLHGSSPAEGAPAPNSDRQGM